MKYREFLRIRSASKKQAIKEALLAYAAEDVRNLRDLKLKLVELMAEANETEQA